MLKKNSEWVIFFILFAIILGALLSLLFYKAFCRLDQIVDWGAISAISSVFMGLLTVMAIFIAIYIPQKDRITSSKIELFNQRFETYYFIVNHFTTAFEKGKTQFEDTELMKLGYKSEFLIDKEDDHELNRILAIINSKRLQKFKDENNPDLSISIDKELELIDKLFDKYLNLREYGVEHKKLP